MVGASFLYIASPGKSDLGWGETRFIITELNLYGELPDLAPTLRKVTEVARTVVHKPRDPQAIAAAALGVDAIGLIFAARSKRRVDPAAAAAIQHWIPLIVAIDPKELRKKLKLAALESGA